MAKLIKCPRCQSTIDATSAAGGATVRCSDCGAMVRIPTGSTGVYPKAQQQPVAAAAGGRRESTKVRAVGGRNTDLFRKMSGVRAPGGSKPPSRNAVAAEERASGGYAPRRRGGNTALIGLACGGGILLLVGLLAFGMMAKKDSLIRDKDTRAENLKQRQAEADRQNAINRKIERDEQAAIDAAAAAAKADEKAGKKKNSLSKGADGAYTAPPTFEPGAKKHAKAEDLKVEAGLMREYDSMMASGRVGDAVKEPAKWMPCVLMGLLNDDEKIARGSFQALNDLCIQFKVSTESGKSPVEMHLVNSAYARGNNFNFWRDWWDKPQNRAAFGIKAAVEELKTMGGGSGENPTKVNWDDLMKDLRAGGAFDVADRPEGRAFARVKAMGPAGLPHVIKFIDHEELPLGKAAVTVLNAITGRSSPLPNEGNKGQLKNEWDAWYAKEHGGK